jgi:hypothetical protein
LTEQEQINLEYLITKNKIIPLSYVYQNTLNYYDSLISVLGGVITFLIALLGVSAFMSWLSLRSRIEDTIKEELKLELLSDFYKAWLGDLIDAASEKILTEKLPDWIKDKENALNDITERVKNTLDMERERTLPTNSGRLIVPQ